MLLYYVRHGDPIYNPDSLTPLGQRQAEAVGRRLAMHGIDKIYASTSQRAILTATPLSEIMHMSIETLDFANETHAWNELGYVTPNGRRWLFHLPQFKGLFHSDEIIRLGDKWYTHEAFADYNYKTGLDRIAKGTNAFLEDLGYRCLGRGKYEVLEPKYERVALFAHQGFGLAFLSNVIGIPYPTFTTHFDISHSSFTVIDFQEEEGYAYPKVLTLSNDSHIYKEGLPTKYNNVKYI